MDFILGKKNLHKELKDIARSTNKALGKRDSSNKDGSSQTSPLFQKGKTMQEKSKREGTRPLERPRQK